ncbi:MAG TPA: DUF58 domain-containing protein [Ktedonobacteraceae bacterium]|nr:DUF58 domain-containing protein [Ktedonobacteraceae bacterium]
MNKQWYYLCIAIILLGLLLRLPLLLVIGLLGVLILAATDIWAKYCLHDLRYQRQFSEQRVLFGEEITLSLSIENAKLLPLPWLEIEDNVPRPLTFTGRQLRTSMSSNMVVLENLFSLRWYERVTRPYTVFCNARGVHAFGPTVLRSGDVFGFLNRQESLSNRQYLLVYPLVVPLTRFSLPSHHPFGDNRAPRRLLEDPARVIGVRDYMYGDDLRRVHWKATARMMQLQSKVYQATTTYTLVLFLNVVSQLDAWYGIHPELQELAICATASVADWALNEGFAVGLYANTIMYMPEMGMALPTSQDGAEKEQGLEAVVADQLKRRRIHLPPASNEEQRKRIMEVLARVQSYFGSSLEDLIQAERTRLPAGATVVVITSTVSDPLLDSLSRVKQSGHAVTILHVGDTPLSTKLAGVTVYHIGGEETWKELHASCSRGGTSPVTTGEPTDRQPAPASFSL